MGAKASDKYLVTAQLMYLVEKVRCIQGFNIKQEVSDGGNGVIFQMGHSISMASWGEDITLTMQPYNETQTVVEVLSKCIMPTQVIDMGQNKQNVKDILGYLLNGLQVQQLNF